MDSLCFRAFTPLMQWVNFTHGWVLLTNYFEYLLLKIRGTVYSIFGVIVDSLVYSIFWVVVTGLFCSVEEWWEVLFFIHVLISISFDFITELCFEICILRLTLSYWLGWIWQLLLQGCFPVRLITRPNCENARRDCLGSGGDLVSMANQSEMSFVYSKSLLLTELC